MKTNGHSTAVPEELCTVKDAAKFIRVHTITMYRWTRTPEKKGGPPVYRTGKKKNVLRIPKQKFIEWVTNTQGAV